MKQIITSAVFLFILLLAPGASFARQVDYLGGEVRVFVTPGEPTVVSFPDELDSGFKSRNADLQILKKRNDLILFAGPALQLEGAVVVVYTKKNKRSFILRVLPARE